MVVSPAVLYHPHTGTVSVHLSELNETVRVSVRLERGDGPSAIPLLEREVQEPRLHENVRFQVSPRPQPWARPRALAMGTEPVSPGSAAPAQPQGPGTAGLRGLALGTELVTHWAAVAAELETIPQQRQAGGSGDGVGGTESALASNSIERPRFMLPPIQGPRLGRGFLCFGGLEQGLTNTTAPLPTR